MSKTYIDKNGWRYRVMLNKGYRERFGRGYRVCYKPSWTAFHGAGVEWRATAAEAQADLDALASRKGWRDVADNE